MNKFIKKILSAGLAFTMLPAFGGTTGVKAAPVSSINYDFETSAQYDTVKGVFAEKYQENSGNIWHSAIEYNPDFTDSLGDKTGAVAIKWNQYDEIGKNTKGTDSFFRFASPDYSGKAYTSFDFMLDSANSSIQVYNRIPVGGSAKSLVFINASTSSLKLLGQTVNEKISAGKWYHVSFVTEYDGDKTVTGSAWLDGVMVVDSKNTEFTPKPDCIDGSVNGANYLTFASYYSASGQSGAWFDNITFNQAADVNINTGASVVPESGSVIESGEIEYVFGADIDASNLSVNDIVVKKNNEVIEPEYIKISSSKLKIKIADEDISDGSDYEITLPEVSDILGNKLGDSFTTVVYQTPELIPITLVSPAGGYVYKGAKIVLSVEAIEDVESVNFYANDEFIGEAVKNDGICNLEWIPEDYGEYEISAVALDYETKVNVTVMKASAQNVAWSVSGTHLGGNTPSYDGTDGRNPQYVLSGSCAVDTYSSSDPKITMVKGGIYSLEADVYTDSDGDGIIPALSTESNAMKNSVNLAVIQSGNLLSKRGGDVWGEGVFGKNEWHNLKIVVDMTGNINTYDVYVDGIQYANDIPFSNVNYTEKVGRIKIELVNKENGAVFLDNVKLLTLIESSGIYIFGVSPEDGTKAEAGKGIMLVAKLTDDSDEAIDVESVVFYKDGVYLGEGEKISDTEYGFMWIPDEAGNVKILAEAYAEDKEFSEEISFEVFDFYTKENVIKRIITPNNCSITLEGSDDIADSSNAADTSIAVKIKGFKESGDDSGSAGYVQINAGGVTQGIVVYDFDVKFDDADQGVRVYNRPDGTNVPDTGINFVKGKICYGDLSSNNVETGYTYEADKWYNVRIVWNIDNGVKDIYLDGRQIVFGAPVKFSDEKNISQIRTEITNLWKSEGNAVIKNETLRFASVASEFTAAEVKDSNGDVLDKDFAKSDLISSIDVLYNQSLLAKCVNNENIKLYRGDDKNVEVPGVKVSCDDNIININIEKESLEPASQYILVLENIQNTFGLVAKNAEFEFRTNPEGRGIYGAEFTSGDAKLENLAGLNGGETVNVNVKAINTKSEKCYIVMTHVNLSDNGSKVKSMSITPVSFEQADKEITVSASLKLKSTPEDGDSVRVFMWDKSTLPLGDGFVLR